MFDEKTLSRFWSKVDRREPNECWEWKAYKSPGGYGVFWIGKLRWRAHRLSWAQHNGSIPSGMSICHRCDRPPCVNPGHLFLGTPADNVHDMVKKGRHRQGGVGPGGLSNHSKLTWAQVNEIREQYQSGSMSFRKIGLKYGVSKGTIQSIINRRNWK